MAHLRRTTRSSASGAPKGQALYQLFMYDPNGIKVELNFDAAEAGAWSRRSRRRNWRSGNKAPEPTARLETRA